MNWLSILAAALFVLACGASGGLVLLHRARRIRVLEQRQGIVTPHLPQIASAIGVIAGIVMSCTILHFAAGTTHFVVIEWIGRGSYLLVTGAAAGHLLILVRTVIHLIEEENGWVRKGGPLKGTLGHQRLRALQRFRRQHVHYIDLKTRDEQTLEELVGTLGTPLLNARNDLTRIPFYGYLGTVCGILLMAQQLSYINEATEPFKVLSSMSEGLVLAFRTTLVSLLAYLPLKKATDYLIRRLGRLEDAWIEVRDAEEPT